MQAVDNTFARQVYPTFLIINSQLSCLDYLNPHESFLPPQLVRQSEVSSLNNDVRSGPVYGSLSATAGSLVSDVT